MLSREFTILGEFDQCQTTLQGIHLPLRVEMLKEVEEVNDTLGDFPAQFQLMIWLYNLWVTINI